MNPTPSGKEIFGIDPEKAGLPADFFAPPEEQSLPCRPQAMTRQMLIERYRINWIRNRLHDHVAGRILAMQGKVGMITGASLLVVAVVSLAWHHFGPLPKSPAGYSADTSVEEVLKDCGYDAQAAEDLKTRIRNHEREALQCGMRGNCPPEIDERAAKLQAESDKINSLAEKCDAVGKAHQAFQQAGDPRKARYQVLMSGPKGE